jgi:hypothetical protein
MTAKSHLHLSKRQILALRGIRLPVSALKVLRETGIYCDPSVSIEYQDLARKYVIRGRESGGAVAHIGAYCGFVDMNGDSLAWLSRIDTVGRNGIHAVVVAQELMRIQMFRNGQTCDLLVTRHALTFRTERKRPTLENSIIFHGSQGTLSQEGTLPSFHTRGGVELFVPAIFRDAVGRAVMGTRCIGCHHCHVMKPQVEPITTSLVGTTRE